MLFKVEESIVVPERVFEEICNLIEDEDYTFSSAYREVIESWYEKRTVHDDFH